MKPVGAQAGGAVKMVVKGACGTVVVVSVVAVKLAMLSAAYYWLWSTSNERRKQDEVKSSILLPFLCQVLVLRLDEGSHAQPQIDKRSLPTNYK
jgi:hypothetical protein